MMMPEDKQLLLKDLCGRLLYGVKGTYYLTDGKGEVTCWGNASETVTNIDIENSKIWTDDTIQGYYLDEFKPYLRPMSSMVEEEREEFYKVGGVMSHNPQNDHYAISAFTPEAYDWLNAHHFDYRGLIEKRLALEALEGMYKVG